jgi:hypothetical protein
MTEARITLVIFGILALVMIAVPLGMIMSAPAPVTPAQALQGDVARFFLGTAPAREAGRSRQVLPDIVTILPPGLAAQAAFDKLEASGFACAPDAAAADCSRHYTGVAGCDAEWRVSLSFDGHATLKTSEADRRTVCL